MPIPQYNPLSVAQGLQSGLELRRQNLEQNVSLKRLAQEQLRLEEEQRRNQAQEGIERGRLGEQAREFNVGFGDTSRRTNLLEQEQALRERAQDLTEKVQTGQLGVQAFSAVQDAINRADAIAEERRHAEQTEALGRGQLGLEREKFGAEQPLRERAQSLAEQTQLGQLGLEREKLAADIPLRQRAQALAEREIAIREAQENRRLEISEKQFIANQALERERLGAQTGIQHEQLGFEREKFGAQLPIQQRAQALAEREVSIREAQENRRLSVQEKQEVFNEVFQREQLSEQKRHATVTEGLGTREQAERERAARVGEGFSGRQVTVTEREQDERERAGSAARDLARQQANLEREKFNLQQLNDAVTREVQKGTLSLQQANSIRNTALEKAKLGFDIQKWLTMAPGEMEKTEAETALRRAEVPYYRALGESATTKAEATSLRASAYADRIDALLNSPQGKALTFEQRKALQEIRDTAAQKRVETQQAGAGQRVATQQTGAATRQVYGEQQKNTRQQQSLQQARDLFQAEQAMRASGITAANQRSLSQEYRRIQADVFASPDLQIWAGRAADRIDRELGKTVTAPVVAAPTRGTTTVPPRPVVVPARPVPSSAQGSPATTASAVDFENDDRLKAMPLEVKQALMKLLKP